MPESHPAGCLDDHTLAALAEGSLAPAARQAAVVHLAGCERCRALFAGVARLVADPDVAREAGQLEQRGRRRLLRIAVPLAAAAALLLYLVPSVLIRRPVDGESHRAPTLTGASAPIPVSPIGTVGAVTTLRWNRVNGADHYRITLFDAQGVTLYEALPADTLLTLPDSVRLSPGARYYWKVEARINFDRWSASPLVEFTIGGEPPR